MSQAATTASTSAQSGTAGTSLAEVMADNPHALALLNSLGYQSVADLKEIGVSGEDWPDLFEFLAGCELAAFHEHYARQRTGRSNNGDLDPLELFLLHSE